MQAKKCFDTHRNFNGRWWEFSGTDFGLSHDFQAIRCVPPNQPILGMRLKEGLQKLQQIQNNST